MTETKTFRLEDLIAAPFTPLLDDGEINYDLIDKYADYLASTNFKGVFVNGTLAEGMSLTLDERKSLAERWISACKGKLSVIIHVGTNCIKDSQELSKHAAEKGANAIAAFTPSYNKPDNEEVLVEVMAQIAATAPNTPFYYYDINFCTGLYIDIHKFLTLAKDKIPTLRGLKHSSRELPAAHSCLGIDNGRFQVLMGTDNQYLSCLALGLPGVVSVSFLGHLFSDMKQAFDSGDIKTARQLQEKAQTFNNVRMKYAKGGIATAKSLFIMLSGMNVGPVRLPLRSLTSQEVEAMRKELDAAGVLDIAKPREQ